MNFGEKCQISMRPALAFLAPLYSITATWKCDVVPGIKLETWVFIIYKDWKVFNIIFVSGPL